MNITVTVEWYRNMQFSGELALVVEGKWNVNGAKNAAKTKKNLHILPSLPIACLNPAHHHVPVTLPGADE